SKATQPVRELIFQRPFRSGTAMPKQATEAIAEINRHHRRARANMNIWFKTLLVGLACSCLFNCASFADQADDYLNSARDKYNKHDLDGTLADLTKAILLKPNYAEAYFNRAMVEQAKGDLSAALVDL